MKGAKISQKILIAVIGALLFACGSDIFFRFD